MKSYCTNELLFQTAFAGVGHDETLHNSLQL